MKRGIGFIICLSFVFILIAAGSVYASESSFGAGRQGVVGGMGNSISGAAESDVVEAPVDALRYGLKDHYIEVDGKKIDVGPNKQYTPDEENLLAKCDIVSCGISAVMAAADRLGLDNPSFDPIIDARDSVSGNIARGILGLFSDQARLISTPADMVRMADATGMEVKNRIVGKSPDEMNKAIQDAWAQGDQVVYRTQKSPIDQHWSNYEGPGGEMLKQESEQDNGGMGKIVDAFVFTKKK